MNRHIIQNEKVHTVGEWRVTVREGNKIVEVKRMRNVVTKGALTLVASAIGNDLPTLVELQANYQYLGTGTTVPTFIDTALAIPETSTWKLLNSSSHDENVLNITAFWSAGEATGTWEEFAVYINGNATAGTGTMLNRLLLGSVNVLASNSITIDGTITFT
jgi:hypothetical protein